MLGLCRQQYSRWHNYHRNHCEKAPVGWKNCKFFRTAEACGQSLALILHAMSSGRLVNLERYNRAEWKKSILWSWQTCGGLVWPQPFVSCWPTLGILLRPMMVIALRNFLMKGRKPSTREWDKSGPTWQEKGANIQCNLTDVLNRLWIGSDSMISLVRANARTRCYKFRKLGHNKQNCPLGDKASTDEEIKEFFL